MGEAQRALRYAIPGSVTEFLFLAWLLLDAQLCPTCYSSGYGFETPLWPVVFLLAPIPLGFLASALQEEIRWRTSRIFRPRPPERFISAYGEKLGMLGIGRGREAEEATVSFWLRALSREPSLAPVVAYVESRLDLLTGLASAFVAVVFAPVATVATLAITSWKVAGPVAIDRLVTAGLASSGMLLVAAVLLLQERRVSLVVTDVMWELFSRATDPIIESPGADAAPEG